jgi:hypothetical protein
MLREFGVTGREDDVCEEAAGDAASSTGTGHTAARERHAVERTS